MMATPTVSSPPRPYYEPQARYGHSSNIVGEKLFTYGGEYGKAGTTSRPPGAIEIFDITRRMWEQKPTLGRPPLGFIHAASATIGTKIYYYGGHNTSKYSNSMHTLDTVTLEWSEVGPRNPARNSEAPIAKAGGAMMSYLEKLLVMFGGFGEMPAKPANKTLYVPTKRDKKRGWTSELHCFDIDHGTWTSPQTTGTPPPACEGCSLTRVDEHRAVFFGGMQLGEVISNNVYILELQSWTWIIVESGPGQLLPVGRQLHSAVSLHDPDSHPTDPALLMMWGSYENDVVLSDAWNFNVNIQQWQQVILPDFLNGRIDHTSSIVHRDSTHKQLVTHGGYHDWPKKGGIVPVTATIIVELEHTPSRDWVVGDIIRISQTGQSVETVIQPGAMSPSTLQVEMEQLNQELAKKVQEYKVALAHSQQTQLSLAQALAEKDLQIRSHPAKLTELQAALARESRQKEEGEKQLEEAEKQLKTNQKELYDVRLKVDELEEKKEKLEGQLQFSQDTVKELQEQLSPPEKSDQAIQTHREPSYLQILAQTSEKEQEFQATLEQRENQLDWERQQREEVEQQLKDEREKLVGHQKELYDVRLKVDGLEEKKEKLEGQLQFSQDTVKELQEQLTPPEKSDQAIQTHRELSYLQILAQTSEKEQEFQATLEQWENQLDWERQQREEVEQQLKDEREKLVGHQKELYDVRLKVDGLEEKKEKLEGQLQFSQDTVKELQEQLTPPEKSDQAIQTHRELSYLQILAQTSEKEQEFQATLEQWENQLDWERQQREEVEQQLKDKQRKVDEMQLQIDELREREKLVGHQLQSSQSTGEAALTTKETQEQLSQPEKRDHKVYQIRGVHVVGETTFTATRYSTTLNWEEYGFTLHIPKGALPPHIEQCHIHVKATIRGQFQLPDDHELVSAVFWIWCRHKLSKPATMEIEHCAAITSDKQCSGFTFVRTHCSQEKLPYIFKPVSEGVFSPDSCYGSISLSHFSGVGIASRKRSRSKGSTASAKRRKHDSSSLTPSGEAKPTLVEEMRPTEIVPSDLESLEVGSSPAHSPNPKIVESDQEEEKDTKRYCAQLYCAHRGGSWWLLYFVLIRDLKTDMQAVNTYFTGKATLEIESIKLTLEEDQITLDIPMEGVTQEGWKVMPCYCPTITKEDTHHFVSGSSMPALCELKAEWLHDQRRPHCLNHPTKIIGARPPRNYFLLTVTPVVETGQDTAVRPKSLSRDSSDRQSLSPPTTASTDVRYPVFGQQSSQDTVRSPTQDSSDWQPSISSGGNAQLQSPGPTSPQYSSTGPPKPELKDLVLLPANTWYDLGLQLDISYTDLDQIQADHPQDNRACRREMFKMWLTRNPSSSYEQLVNALVKIGEKTVADNLCKEHRIPLPESS